jgi:hypothetical protein
LNVELDEDERRSIVVALRTVAEDREHDLPEIAAAVDLDELEEAIVRIRSERALASRLADL